MRQTYHQRARLNFYDFAREKRCEVCTTRLGFRIYRHRVTKAEMCSRQCYTSHNEEWQRRQRALGKDV